MPEEKKELPIPRNGIDVMNDLSLDARTMISLAHEDLLKPYIPTGITKQYFMLCMSSRFESPESFLSTWMYRKSDVEEFMLKHKVYWEKLRQNHGLYPTAPEPQSDTAPETTEKKDSPGSRVNERLALALEFAKMLDNQITPIVDDSPQESIEGLTCPNCGHVNKSDLFNCEKCGAELL